ADCAGRRSCCGRPMSAGWPSEADLDAVIMIVEDEGGLGGRLVEAVLGRRADVLPGPRVSPLLAGARGEDLDSLARLVRRQLAAHSPDVDALVLADGPRRVEDHDPDLAPLPQVDRVRGVGLGDPE